MKATISSLKFNSFVIGIGLFSIPVLSLLITSLFFVCGSYINSFIFPSAIILSTLLMFLVTRKNKEDFIFSALTCLLIVTFSIAFSTYFYDFSWDGQTYHQDIILQLNNGWNPFYEHHAPNALPAIAIWDNHYCKGFETISATIAAMTGEIESGKSVNLILIFASGFLFFHYLKINLLFLSFKIKILLSFLFTLCTVVIAQSLTYYIDWASYSLFLILVPALICYEKTQSKIYIGIICSVILLAVTIKFNLLFWIIYTMIIYFAYLLYRKKMQLLKKLFLTTLISGIFAVFVVGFNPYITNTIDHKHPMYPIMGERKQDVVDWCTPPAIKDKNRFTSVFASLFALPNNNFVTYEPLSSIFLINKYPQYLKIPSTDTRIAGFGIFFSWTLLCALILYLAIIIYKKDFLRNKQRNKYNFILIVLFISLFILPYSWLARYFPFFYAFPLIMCLYFENEKNNIPFLKYRYIIYVLLSLNILSMGATTLYRANRYTKKIDNGIELFLKSNEPVLINFGYNVSLKIKMDKKEVKYQETTEQLGAQDFSASVTLDSAKYIIDNHSLVEK